METTYNPTIATTYTTQNARNTSLVQRFINWSKEQQGNQFGWLAAALATHGCALTPITLFAIVLSGNAMIFWVLALVAMGSALVTNLAAMPTKITIPVFFASVLLDLMIIFSCVVLMI